jgi:hypothetical protein
MMVSLVCVGCHAQLATYHCSACQCAHYCSEKCQRVHWQQHKPMCQFLQAEVGEKRKQRPDDDPTDIIVFKPPASFDKLPWLMWNVLAKRIDSQTTLRNLLTTAPNFERFARGDKGNVSPANFWAALSFNITPNGGHGLAYWLRYPIHGLDATLLPAGTQAFGAAWPLSLRVLDSGGNQNFMDAGLQSFTQLTTLVCSQNVKFTDTGLQSLTQLTTLDCGWNENFTDAGLQALKQLTTLNFGRNQKFTYAGLQALKLLATLNTGRNAKFTQQMLTSLRVRGVDVV